MSVDLEAVATHGNVVVAEGFCPVCEREGRALTELTTKAGEVRRACANEFSCADAYASGRRR